MKSWIVFLLGLMSAVPASAHQDEPGYRKDAIHAIQAWARINPVPGRPSAVYLVLHNESKQDDALLSATSPIAQRTELHATQRLAGGKMTMQMLPQLALKAGDMVLLEPGGMHLMLFSIASPPKPGSRFALTLRFAKGAPQTIQVEARGLADRKDAAPMQHPH